MEGYTKLPSSRVRESESISLRFNLNDFVDPNDELKVAIGKIDVPGAAYVFDTYIKHIHKNCMLVDIPNGIPKDPYLLEGAKVAIKFKKGNQDALNMYTHVVGHQEEPPSGCWLEAPQDFISMFLKRRRHVRVPFHFEFKAFYLSNGKELPVNAECINMSGGGMRFSSTKQFQMAESILLEFSPDRRFQLLKVFGEVVFSQPLQYKTNSKYDVVTAVQFNNLIQYQEDQLVGFCFRKELEQQRHLKS